MTLHDPNQASAAAPGSQKRNAAEGKRVYVETLGCAKNRVDSEIMLAALRQAGFELTTDETQAQAIVVNTCAFLTSASEESIARLLELSDLKSSGACEKLVAAGCLSERYREGLLEEIPELDGLLGSSDFQALPSLLRDLYAGRAGASVHLAQKPHYAHYEGVERLQSTPAHTVYVKIAEGCSNMCSFCNIPYLRGYFSSRGVQSIVQEVRGHVARGIREINLISQDTSSYGVDLAGGENLARLLREIDGVEGEFWVRLLYAYPNTFDHAVMDALSDSRHILPYLDMPFQHISDGVLRDMNRRITEKEIRGKLKLLRERIPDLALRTTFITGFPTESAEDFARLLEFVEEGWFDHVGVFAYSHEDNIVSRRFGDPVPSAEKRRRRKALLQSQQKISTARNAARVGQICQVLVEGYAEETDLLLQGRAPFQAPEVDGVVLINEGQATAGAFHRVRFSEAHAYDLVGEIVNG